MTTSAIDPNPAPSTVPGSLPQVPTSATSASPTDPKAWDAYEPAQIIELILKRYHEPLKRDLPALVADARLVEAKNLGKALSPVGLGDLLEQTAIAVESHLAKEEKILFPLIVAGRGAMALMPIKVMMAEHEDHGANLVRMHTLTHDFALPNAADGEWRDLYRRLAALESDLKQHIALENDVLFPRAMASDPAGR